MEWVKKNWLMLIIIVIAALPLIESLLPLTISFNSGGLSFGYIIPEHIRARLPHAGRQLSVWGLPLHLTGEWAIRMMVITLTCTPLCILFGNSKILRYKKVFGIFAFLYTVLHLTFYLADHNVFEIFTEVNLILALIATIIIIPLGITSNKLSMRLLKKNWKKLQQFAYAAAIASVLHLALLGKGSWLFYTIILAAGFILRIPEVKAYFRKGRSSYSVESAT